MPLTAPNLDDRRFEDLVAEAKARIPGYTPEWTDFNESDPGMALLQLHAWLTETILYQLNRAPDLHYIKFLQLLGIERGQARPARAELTFTLKKNVLDTVIIPKGTRVGVSDSDLERPPVFETELALTTIAGSIAEIVTIPIRPEGSFGTPLSRTTANQTPGTTFNAFRDGTPATPRRGDALYLGFDIPGASFPTDEITLLIYLRDPALAMELGASPTPEDETPVHTCLSSRQAAEEGRRLVWEFYQGRIGPGGAQQWGRLDVSADQTLGLTRSGYVFVRGPSEFPRANPDEVVSAKSGPISLRAPLDFSHDPGPPVVRLRETVGASLEPDTTRTMPRDGTELAVNDAIAATLLAGQIVRVRSTTNPDETQYVIVDTAGSRTIRGKLHQAFDPANVLLHTVTLNPAAGDPPRTLVKAAAAGAKEITLDVNTALSPGDILSIGGNSPSQLELAIASTTSDLPNLFWFRLRVDAIESDARPPKIDSIQINTVTATAALSVTDEIVGSSDGRPGQTFNVRNTPILHDPPFVLEIDEGQGPKPWKEVIDFHASSSAHEHYVLNHNSGEIRFGDGRHGRVPIAGTDNIIARSYRHGGGLQTNAGRGTITDLQSPVREVDSVTNVRNAAGGADEEPESDTRLRAPHTIRTQERAVTADDFQLLALETPGGNIARAVALPLVDPYQPGVDVRGAVTVMVVPESDSPRPQPDAATLALVCAHLDARRLVTTEVYIRGPQYHAIELEMDAIARSDADLRTVKSALEETLTAYLHPLRGGEDGKGWPFGGAIYYSELLRQALSVPGIQRIGDISITRDDILEPTCSDVMLQPGHLIWLERLSTRVMYQR